MAQELPDFEFPTARPRAEYPWEEWFNGNPWKLVPKVDFTTSTENFRTLMYENARRRDMHIQSRVLADGALVLKATPKDELGED